MTSRRRISLVRVARIYRESVASGLPPAKTVAEVLDLPYDTATKKIADARHLDLLPPHRSPDLHKAVMAEIHRGGVGHRRFEVCEVCLTPAPCDIAIQESLDASSTTPTGEDEHDDIGTPTTDDC